MKRQANGLRQAMHIIVISVFNSFVVAYKVGNITYDEQTHMRTINGKLNALIEGVVSL